MKAIVDAGIVEDTTSFKSTISADFYKLLNLQIQSMNLQMKLQFLLSRIIIIFFLLINLQSIEAQNFHLVKDININTNSNPHNSYNQSNVWYNETSNTDFAVLNGIGYFSADDGVNGYGLWRSDGTAQGTYEIKDSINPVNITVSNGKIFFFGQSTGAIGLWSCDGTSEGTFHIFDPVRENLMRDPTPGNLTDVNGTLYFTVSNTSGVGNLWKSDGTIAGTILVYTFERSSVMNPQVNFSNFTSAYNKLYFGENSYIWVSDGTSSGTYATTIAGHTLTPRSSNISDSLLYFLGSDSSTRVWVYNVKEGNATIVKGVNNIAIGDNIVNVSGTLYFTGYAHQTENLYKYDTYADTGVALVKAEPPGSYGFYDSHISNVTNINGSLFYNLYDAQNNKNQLWKTDGTIIGNTLLKDNVLFDTMVNVNGTCFAQAVDSVHGNELWKSDGTANGTVLVKDIFPGENSSSPQSLTNVNGSLLFSAEDNSHGIELWKSDGTDSGTFLLKDINQRATDDAHPDFFIPFRNVLLFSATDGKKGYQLWKSDGTEAGTTVISDSIYASYLNGIPNDKNEFYFFGSTTSGLSGLFKTDATANGTALVKDFTGTDIDTYFDPFFSGSELTYFIVSHHSSAGYELWRTDGTDANTFAIKKGISDFQTAFLGNTFFFNVNNDLWKTDGTVAGTLLLKSFKQPVYDLTAFNGDVYFGASNGTVDGLWKTDGTPSGTINISNAVTGISNLTPSNGMLYFSAQQSSGVEGLFKTDGTFGGTYLVKGMYYVPYNNQYAYPNNLISVKDVLYFFMNNDLWKTQGTDSSTQFISTTNSLQYSQINKVVNANGELFIFSDSLFYQSDGTKAGTKLVQDDNLAGVILGITIDPFRQVVATVGDKLFIAGENYKYGSELYAGSISGALPVTLISFSGMLKNDNSLLRWSTANEQNSKYFIVERSFNSIDFLPVASIAAKGNTSNRTEYSYIDPDVVSLGAEKLYYRLKQVDIDGKLNYSNVVVISLNDLKPEFTVVPNPVKNTINILSSTKANDIQVKLLDVSGKVLYNSIKDFSPGEQLSIDVSRFSKGLYIVSIQNKNTRTKIKVLKD
ncbi:MAG: T9SS type A sorting domain-containing protein [Bacteroidota bacterium]|nr:T9SS type A sorting domain-containing protein [Bacteroidota bacterium]